MLAGQWLDGTTGSELLGEVRRLHPHAKRGLLIAWGDWGDPGDRQGDVRRDGPRPDRPLRARPSAIAGRAVPPGHLELAARVGGRDAHRSAHDAHRRRVMVRTGVRAAGGAGPVRPPARLLPRRLDEGRALLADGRRRRRTLPLVVFPDGKVLADPTQHGARAGRRVAVDPARRDFDLVIVGAGPAGLSAAVYGASEGFSTLVVDKGGLGGQATSSSLIRNYLGFPRGISGRRLAEQAYEQAWVFGAKFAFMQRGDRARRDGERLFVDALRCGDGAHPRGAARHGRQLSPARGSPRSRR